MSTCMTIEQIAAYDLKHNYPNATDSLTDWVKNIEFMKGFGWECDQIRNTIFLTMDEGQYVRFHTMTADKIKPLFLAIIEFYIQQYNKGKKYVYTYFTHPTLKRMFARAFGAETFVLSDFHQQGRYKVIIDLEEAIKVKNTSPYYQKLLGVK